MEDEHNHQTGWLRNLAETGLVPWLVAAAVTVAIWSISNANRADQTAQNLADFRTNVTQQISDLRAQMNSNFSTLQNQIAALPDYAARLHAVESHQVVVDGHLSAVDGRLDTDERQQYQMSVTLGDITKASQVPLTGPHR